ncbi:hypothetical protein E4T38_03374 [Aureobasidium subglaciale]|nr:hypothetical protein E4T38_03374 [Aureobasidium subglaciale]KAI5226158.1 hypothetical protein E4T40_03249 [Aureobasidium subglaciale]KAI5229559.1 hypothetical protein E4T41_03371 [Aureobasidium subglaciale]KAI5264261.1 hypothetical protein E4T46_03149 [Aureobasidium subglaciale]
MHNSTSIPSYPTRCTTFLDDLAKDIHDSRHLNGNTNGSRANEPGVIPPRALVPLDIIIVGAGLGGLATSIALSRRGHKVRVLEQATALGEVGAGIQIPSNSSRILLDWGLGSFLKGKVVEPENITFRRWEDGSAVGFTKLIPEFQKSFDAPYYVVHRADFHDAMHKLALELGVEVLVSSRVVRYNSEDAAVETANGRKYSGDLVIAADGVKSLARAVIIGTTASPPVPTGFAAYRATVDVEKMKEDPEIAWLLETSALNVWFEQENVVQDIRDSFAGWDPCLMKIIHLIDKGLKWPLLSGEVLNRWLDPSGKLLLIGDAAHAMVPYMSQGAAMAVEDGAALGEILSIVEHKSQIHSALSVFERVRMQRTSQMQEASLLNGKIWHFADGPEQRARDASMRAEVEGKQFISSPNQWSDPVTQWWAYGYRAADEVVKAWKESLSAKNL